MGTTVLIITRSMMDCAVSFAVCVLTEFGPCRKKVGTVWIRLRPSSDYVESPEEWRTDSLLPKTPELTRLWTAVQSSPESRREKKSYIAKHRSCAESLQVNWLSDHMIITEIFDNSYRPRPCVANSETLIVANLQD